MKKTLLLLFLFVLQINLLAQNQNRPLGANSAGFGNAGVSYSDVWSVFHNQAGLAELESLNVGLYFHNKYGIKELSHSAFAVALPTKSGTFGLSYSFFGYSNYNESKIGLAFGKKLFENLSAGIQLDYFSTSIAGNYGRGGAVTAETGLIYSPVENLKIGAHAFNPVRSSYGTYDDEALASGLKIGASYLFSDKLLYLLEFESDFENTSNFKTGFEYSLSEDLFLRLGVNTNPSAYSFGAGYKLSAFIFDIAFSHHNVLGYSTMISLRFNKQNK